MNAILEPLEHIAVIITSIVAMASTITAVTNTPTDGGIKGILYRIVEFLAIVTEKTKQKP